MALGGPSLGIASPPADVCFRLGADVGALHSCSPLRATVGERRCALLHLEVRAGEHLLPALGVLSGEAGKCLLAKFERRRAELKEGFRC